MRKLFIGTILTITLFTINAFAQCGGCTEQATCDKAEANLEVTTAGTMVMIDLPTVQCGMCKETVESGLSKVDGIKSVIVDVEKKTAQVKYDPAKLDVGKIETAVSSLGYQANKVKADKEAYAKLADCCKPDKS